MAVLLVLAGCASTPPAPVEDRSTGGRRHAQDSTRLSEVRLPSGSYRVQRGDTLYSIAFRNGLDYRELAQTNRIGPPYTIYVGQILRLDRAGAASAAPGRETVRQRPAPAPTATAPSRPVVSAAPAATSTQPARPPPSTPPEKPATGAVAGASESASSAGVSWRWPADGAQVSGYVAGDQTQQGINITGKAGDPVRAAADGEVVYSGNGLIGYGELIIVKHNASLLSAYGHNRRRLVQEGDKVKAGQQIAEMGSSSASRDMLHFEIRRNGKPMDPLILLPRR